MSPPPVIAFGTNWRLSDPVRAGNSKRTSPRTSPEGSWNRAACFSKITWDAAPIAVALLPNSKGERRVVEMPLMHRVRSGNWSKWAIAAGLAVVSLYLGRHKIDQAFAPSGPRATVESASGGFFFLDGKALTPGATLSEGQTVRTGPSSRASIRLADGSLVEVNERTQFAVRAAWSGQTIQLDRGDVIVQAAKQRRGHLRVMSADTTASVKGTVFAVSAGSAGSLVSVVEGSVEVQQPGSDRLLTRGEQAASSGSLRASGVRNAVAWSENADKWALVGEFASIEKQLAAMPGPALRTEAKLLAYVPANPTVYVAIPNIGGTMRQAMRLIEQRTRDSAVLKTWWESKQAVELKDSLLNLQSVTPMLGDEIVFVYTRDASQNGRGTPLVLATVNPGQQEALRQALAKLTGDHAPEGCYRVTDSLPARVRLSRELGQGQWPGRAGYLGSVCQRNRSAISARRWLAGRT